MKKAMILAAGYGTRLRPITDNLPKALVPFKNGTMISYQIEKLKAAGIREIVVNAHHFSEQLIKYFQENDFGVKVSVIAEKEILGTGGGVLNAKDYMGSEDSFLVMNVDVYTNFSIDSLIREYEISRPFALLAVQKRNTSRYLEFDDNFILRGRVKSEILKERYYAFNGIHIISKDIFSIDYKNDYRDIIDIYLEEKKPVKGYDAGDSVFIDLGKTENLERAEGSGD
jgi:NDP-sugar pyrophosphorylase family protein